MLEKVKKLLTHPHVREQDIDVPETNVVHSRIIREKPFLRKIYDEWYSSISNAIPANISGPVLELGSGGGFLHQYIPNLITSEILQIPTVDIVLDGQSFPFKSNSLKGVVMVDVFHHLPRVENFLTEAACCIKPGGVIVMIEPWTTAWSRFIYKYLHHEPFHPDAANWHFPEGGPLSQANSALPWITFERDREKFECAFPSWEIHNIHLHTPFCYLLSGGLAYRSFMPGSLFKICRQIEQIMSPFRNHLAMFAMITLKKKNSS